MRRDRAPRGALAAAVVGAVVATAPVARAGVLSEDPLVETSTEAGIVARQFSFVLVGPTLRPPYLPEDDDPLGEGLFDLRLYAATKTPDWKVVVHDQLSGAVRSAATPGELALGRGVAPPRWLPLGATLADDPTITLRNNVDWLYLAWTQGPMTITIGRQPVTFGRSRLWSPLDLIGPFALTEVDTEYKPGVDAVRVDVTAGEATEVTAIGVVGELEDDHDLDASVAGSAGLVRATHRLDEGELGVLAGSVRGDVVAGVDGVWRTEHADLRAEVTVTRVSGRSVGSPLAAPGDVVAKAAAGASLHPTSTLTVDAEALYDGFGAWRPADYLAVAASGRVAIGEQTTLGRLYAGVVADWQAHPLVHVIGIGLVDVRDPSALASVAIAYSVSDNASALIGAYVPVGARPSAADPATPRSEYGLFPYFGFLELKAVL